MNHGDRGKQKSSVECLDHSTEPHGKPPVLEEVTPMKSYVRRTETQVASSKGKTRTHPSANGGKNGDANQNAHILGKRPSNPAWVCVGSIEYSVGCHPVTETQKPEEVGPFFVLETTPVTEGGPESWRTNGPFQTREEAEQWLIDDCRQCYAGLDESLRGEVDAGAPLYQSPRLIVSMVSSVIPQVDSSVTLLPRSFATERRAA